MEVPCTRSKVARPDLPYALGYLVEVNGYEGMVTRVDMKESTIVILFDSEKPVHNEAEDVETRGYLDDRIAWMKPPVHTLATHSKVITNKHSLFRPFNPSSYPSTDPISYLNTNPSHPSFNKYRPSSTVITTTQPTPPPYRPFSDPPARPFASRRLYHQFAGPLLRR